jgi:hypothetical protein
VGIPSSDNMDVCDLCHRGTVVKTAQEIAFRQWTAKGNVFCRLTVPMTICTECGARNLDEAAEAMIDRAVQLEADKLL